MRELDKISAALFDKIRARFDHVNIGDENARRITDPEKARFINFDYISENGENFGNVTISLIDEDNLKIYFGANITEVLDEEQETEWYKFLRGLREFARRNMLNFDVRDINRSNLDLKDIKQQSVADATYDKEELAIAEGRLYGLGNNKRMSFGDVGTHKLIIKHQDQIDPERHGARARKIEHIFIETPIGERFLLDHVNLEGARATANHLRHGGRIGDEGSALINEMVKEMASMRHFVRAMRKRTFEDAETSGMVEAAIYRYNEVRDHLKRFQGRNGHELLNDMCNSRQNDVEETVDVESLRERFVKKIYDDRFNEALPYVYRAYKNKQKMDSPMSIEFESWANEISEETWSADTDDRDEQELTALMQAPIAVGVDAADAMAIISSINFLQSDDLKQALLKLSQTQGPDADARRTIIGWLASNGETALANQFMQILQQQNANTQPAPQQPTPQSQPVGATTMDQPVVQEDIGLLRKLAGLDKNS